MLERGLVSHAPNYLGIHRLSEDDDDVDLTRYEVPGFFEVCEIAGRARRAGAERFARCASPCRCLGSSLFISSMMYVRYVIHEVS